MSCRIIENTLYHETINNLVVFVKPPAKLNNCILWNVKAFSGYTENCDKMCGTHENHTSSKLNGDVMWDNRTPNEIRTCALPEGFWGSNNIEVNVGCHGLSNDVFISNSNNVHINKRVVGTTSNANKSKGGSFVSNDPNDSRVQEILKKVNKKIKKAKQAKSCYAIPTASGSYSSTYIIQDRNGNIIEKTVPSGEGLTIVGEQEANRNSTTISSNQGLCMSGVSGLTITTKK